MDSYTSTKGYDFNDETSRIIQACVEVHKNLGPGFQEVTYQRALALELQVLGLDFSREVKIPVYYKGREIDKRRVDFVVEECMVEIKAKREFDDADYIQTLSYLKASGFQLGLLVNFGAKKIEVRRLVNANREKYLDREKNERNEKREATPPSPPGEGQ